MNPRPMTPNSSGDCHKYNPNLTSKCFFEPDQTTVGGYDISCLDFWTLVHNPKKHSDVTYVLALGACFGLVHPHRVFWFLDTSHQPMFSTDKASKKPVPKTVLSLQCIRGQYMKKKKQFSHYRRSCQIRYINDK